MKWRRGHRSEDVVDARGRTSRGGGLTIGRTTGGIGGALIIVLLAIFAPNLLGGGGFDVGGPILDQLEPAGDAPPAGGPLSGAPDPDAELVQFVSFVLDDVQASWERTFAASGGTYERATLQLFDDPTQHLMAIASRWPQPGL